MKKWKIVLALAGVAMAVLAVAYRHVLVWATEHGRSGTQGESLYQARIGPATVRVQAHLKGEFGRIRAVAAGPDGALYLTTSNRDGRGVPRDQDDLLLRVDPAVFQ